MPDTQVNRDFKSESGLPAVPPSVTALSAGISAIRVAAMALALVALVLPSAPMHAQNAPVNDKLEMVVALFRHGIRPPLGAFASSANQYSGKAWPALQDWHAISGDKGPQWGNLTEHGKLLAQALGRHYAAHYRDIVGPRASGVYFWADVDERTQQTAQGLKNGFCSPNTGNIACHARLKGLDGAGIKDPLFHPFVAGCGQPDKAKLTEIANNIQKNQATWMRELSPTFSTFQTTLNCNGEAGCTPILKKWEQSPDKAKAGCGPDDCPNDPDANPVKWSGAFSYASGATEAFLLEYANNMPQNKVGWGRVNPPNPQIKPPNLGSMLQLHEFFFEKTQREDYIAKIQGSNLVREILDDLERAIKGPVLGCPHGDANSKFVGLVGHDTNLASVETLLNISWKFDNALFPAIPANDALPAGALIFELHNRGNAAQPDYFVRIFYVTFTPQQMRDYKQDAPSPKPKWLEVTSSNPESKTCGNGPHCDIPLDKFNRISSAAIDSKFLSSCTVPDKQTCGN